MLPIKVAPLAEGVVLIGRVTREEPASIHDWKEVSQKVPFGCTSVNLLLSAIIPESIPIRNMANMPYICILFVILIKQ